MYFVVSAIAALTVIKKLSVRASISCFEYYYAIDLGKGVWQTCLFTFYQAPPRFHSRVRLRHLNSGSVY